MVGRRGFEPPGKSELLTFVEPLSQGNARFEGHDPAGGDGDRLPGLRVAAFPIWLRPYHEAAKTSDLEVVSRD